MKYLLLALILTGCGERQTLADQYKCTLEQVSAVNVYMEACNRKTGDYASYCFDAAVKNFCSLKEKTK